MRILVCGGRTYGESDEARADFVQRVLWQIVGEDDGPRTTIIHGGARGADRQAHVWARDASADEMIFRPDWEQYRQAGGPIRNRKMLAASSPELVVAFPGGSGTEDIVSQANKAGVPVVRHTM